MKSDDWVTDHSYKAGYILFKCLDVLSELPCHIYISWTLYHSIDVNVKSCCNVLDMYKKTYLITSISIIIFHTFIGIPSKFDFTKRKICKNVMEGLSLILTSSLIISFYSHYDFYIISERNGTVELCLIIYSFLKIFYNGFKNHESIKWLIFRFVGNVLLLVIYCYTIKSKTPDHVNLFQ